MANQNDIYEKLGHMSAKLDAVHADVQSIKSTVRMHEAINNKVIGYGIAVAAFAGAIGSTVSKSVAGLFQ